MTSTLYQKVLSLSAAAALGLATYVLPVEAGEISKLRVWYTEHLGPGQVNKIGGKRYSQGKISELTLRSEGFNELERLIGKQAFEKLMKSPVDDRPGDPRRDWGDESEGRYMKIEGEKAEEIFNKICKYLQFAHMPKQNVCTYNAARRVDGKEKVGGRIVGIDKIRFMSLKGYGK